MHANNAPPLTLEADTHWFKLIFQRPEAKNDNPLIEKTSKTSSKEHIINLLKQNPYSTIRELSFKTGLSVKTIEWNLNKLKQENSIERMGSRKAGYWVIRE